MELQVITLVRGDAIVLKFIHAIGSGGLLNGPGRLPVAPRRDVAQDLESTYKNACKSL
jgi:hypothetical protein